MSENSEFGQLLEEAGGRTSYYVGEIIEGTVDDVKENELVLNIGIKSDGVVKKEEFTKDASADLTALVKKGDTLTVKVLKKDDGEGRYLLSYLRVQQEKNTKFLLDSFENHTVLTGTVTDAVKGGVLVDVEGSSIFVPASLASDAFERDLSKLKGQTVELQLIECEPKKRRVIGDIKTNLVAKKAQAKAEALSSLTVGDVVGGVVKTLTDFGAFIDLGGIDGLLHISEMSWGRVTRPKDFLKVGQQVEVFVKGIDGDKISLSRKFPDTNPWVNADEKYAPGTIVTGKVARMTDFGAFVELEEGVDALLHVSQIAREHIEKPSDVLTIGQTVTAEVLDLRVDAKKISISVKKILPPAEETAEAPAQTAEAPAEEAAEAPAEEAPAAE